jgi:hypothetical protein
MAQQCPFLRPDWTVAPACPCAQLALTQAALAGSVADLQGVCLGGWFGFVLDLGYTSAHAIAYLCLLPAAAIATARLFSQYKALTFSTDFSSPQQLNIVAGFLSVAVAVVYLTGFGLYYYGSLVGTSISSGIVVALGSILSKCYAIISIR